MIPKLLLRFYVLGTMLLFCLILVSWANCQTIFAIKGGVQLANMQGYDYKPKPLTTIEVKGVALLPLSDAVTLTPSFGFSGKGKQYKNIEFTDELDNSLHNGDIHFIFNYLEFAIPVSYKIIAENKTEYYFGLGPYIEYAINAKSKLKNVSPAAGGTTTNIFPSDVYHRMDAGLTLDVIARIQKRFLVGFNFDAGLTNVTKSSSYVRNQVGGISVGYVFGKKSN
jgi:hypothetical protein